MQRLEYLLSTVPAQLDRILEEEFSLRPAPGKWSRKELLGHLIDSAANNHQRFVRAQFEEMPSIAYQQDNWVAASRYQDMPINHLIEFWILYNRHLLELVQRIPDNLMQRKCYNGGTEPVTLAFIWSDYVAHLERHLGQIIKKPA